MENNSEKDEIWKREEELERAAERVEENIHQLKEMEHREEEVLEELEEEIHKLHEEKEHEGFVDIIVNGTPEKVKKGEIAYNEVVTFAFPDYPQHPERSYSVKYKKGVPEKPEGILSPGGKVKVHKNMVFNVTFTGQS